MRTPSTSVELYRSPRPRTNTYLPSDTESPVTRRSTSPASSSGDRRTCSALTASPSEVAFLRAESSAASVFWRAFASTTTSSCWIASEESAAVNGTIWPATTSMPSTRRVA